MAIVRKDKMLAGYNGNLESVIVHNASDATLEITNGLFVTLGDLMPGEREVHKAVLAGTADADVEVYFIHNSEVMYDERKGKLEDFRIEAGKVARAYHLFHGDVITLTTDLFVAVPVVGDQLVVHTGGKLGSDATALASAKIVFEVIENSGNELHPTMGAFAVKVIRN
jgi:hypothetical protein